MSRYCDFSGPNISQNNSINIFSMNLWNHTYFKKSSNSYIQITGEGCLLIPVGRMNKTENNIGNNNSVLLTITNREVQGKSYTGLYPQIGTSLQYLLS